MLALGDWLLTAVHIAVIAGFVFLWIPRRTVRLHRWLVGLTALSWLGLGYFYGVGYCFLTDWQWSIKRARGVTDLPASFIKYAADAVTGMNLPPHTVDTVAGVTFALGLIAAGLRYWQEFRETSPG